MINKIGWVAVRIIFVYFLGLNVAAFGAPAVADDNALHGARVGVFNVAYSAA